MNIRLRTTAGNQLKLLTEKKMDMGEKYTFLLSGPFISASLPAEFPVSFTDFPFNPVKFRSLSARFVYADEIKCSVSLKSARLRHQGGHLTQLPKPEKGDESAAYSKPVHQPDEKPAYSILIRNNDCIE